MFGSRTRWNGGRVVKETPEYANICLEAVRQNGMAIDFVKETPEFEKILKQYNKTLSR
jgi:hypothetical protein